MTVGAFPSRGGAEKKMNYLKSRTRGGRRKNGCKNEESGEKRGRREDGKGGRGEGGREEEDE